MVFQSDHTLGPDVTAALAEALRPAELTTSERDRMRSRILNRTGVTPPAGTMTIRAREGDWREYAPGVHIKVLREEPRHSSMTFLVRMAPGSVAPPHDHSQEEHCLVLEGEAAMGEHILHKGDWHVALPGSTHSNFSSRTGCLLLIRSEIRQHA